MIIDGHAHLGGEYKDLPAVLSTMQKYGLDRVIACPADHPRNRSMYVPEMAGWWPAENLNYTVNKLIRATVSEEQHQMNIDRGNQEVFNVAAQSEGRVIQFFWANPLKESILSETETKLEEWKFRGVKLHQACHPFKILATPFQDLAELAAFRNIPVFIHLYSKKEVLDFISVAKSYNTTFLVGHLIGLETFIENKDKVSDNVFFDISCPPLTTWIRL